MKHPALARVFAAMLAVFSLVLCFSGAYGITRAKKEKDEQVRQYELLVSRTEEYKKIYDSIVEEKPFDEADNELSEIETAHNKSASEHKADVATYSATKAGIKQGEDLLAQGEAMINMITPFVAVAVGVGTEAINIAESVIYEKEDGSAGVDPVKLAEVETELQQLLEQIGIIQPQVLEYENKLSTISALRTETDGMKLELAGLQSRQAESVEQPEEEMDSHEHILKEEQPLSDKIYEMSDDENIQSELSGDISGEATDEISSETPVAVYSDTDTGYLTVPDSYSDPVSESAPAIVSEGTDIPVIQAESVMPAITYQADAGPVISEQAASFEKNVLICVPIAYEEEIARLLSAINTNEIQLAELTKYTEENREEYESLRAELDEYLSDYSKLKTTLDYAKSQLQGAAIELTKAYSEVIDGYWEIIKQKEELKEKRPVLEEEKAVLDEEYEDITSRRIDNDQLKQAENRMTSLRVLLTKNERIRKATDSGENLITASENEIPQFKDDYESRYKAKLRISILGFAAALSALLGIPAAFEKWRSRFMLIAPVAVYIICTSAAEFVSVKNGLGQAYVPLIASVFGLFQLITVIPKKKVIHT